MLDLYGIAYSPWTAKARWALDHHKIPYRYREHLILFGMPELRWRLKKPFGDYYDRVYFDMAGFEGGTTALNCALEGIHPERLVFASDYPQDFTGVNTDTGKGMTELRNYVEAVRKLPLSAKSREDMLGGTAARLLKMKI